MARSDLVERVQPALHGLSETANSAATTAAGAWRDRGAPATTAFVDTVRTRAVPAATAFAGTVRERAVPAVRDRAVPAVRDRALPAAIAASQTARERAVPVAAAVLGALRDRMQPAAQTARAALAPVIDAATPPASPPRRQQVVAAVKSIKPGSKVEKPARKAAKALKPQRKEATRRAREIKRAARGDKTRRWPFIIGVFAIGAGAGIAVGAMVRRRTTESCQAESVESLNGVHPVDSPASTTATDIGHRGGQP